MSTVRIYLTWMIPLNICYTAVIIRVWAKHCVIASNIAYSGDKAYKPAQCAYIRRYNASNQFGSDTPSRLF